MERRGQISIDYLAGALIFFGSLVFLVSNVMTALPAFSQSQQTDEMSLSAWSISEVVMNDEGYWENATHAGTDWQDHIGSAAVVGVKEGDSMSAEKVDTLTDMNQSWLRSTLQTEKKVNVEFREVVDVDTHRSFQQGDSPDFIREPFPTAADYPDRTAEEIHYGAKRLGGEERYVLLMKNSNLGWYNNLSVSPDRDFSDEDTEFYNLTTTQYIAVGDATYVAEAANTQISGGDLLVLWRGLGRTGDVPRQAVEDIIAVERYGVMDGNVVEVTVRVWE